MGKKRYKTYGERIDAEFREACERNPRGYWATVVIVLTLIVGPILLAVLVGGPKH